MSVPESINKNEHRTLLLALVQLAKADGRISGQEFDLLMDIAVRVLKMSPEEIVDIIQEKIDLHIPKDDHTREVHFSAMIDMITADGVIHPNEIKLLGKIVRVYGIDEDRALRLIYAHLNENDCR